MQSNSENENDFTGNERGEEEPREMRPSFRSMPTAPVAGAITPLAMLTFPGSEKLNDQVRPTPTKNGKWVFDKAKPLPLFPMEKATVELMSSHIVAARICDSLRLRSVHAKFDESQALCTTSSYLTYSIDLYDDGEGNCLLEIIRINGCGFAFRREREAVIFAAQGKGGVPPSTLPTMMKMPEELLKDFEVPSEREHEDTLLRASDQLHSNKYDVQLFVLRNLAAITSPDKVNQESAQIMSILIMRNACDVQSLVVSILGSCLQDHSDRSVLLINSCLNIFTNALSLLSDLKLLEGILIDYDNNNDFIDMVIPHFISIVSNCKCPHNACLALRCLSLLCYNSNIARDILSDESRKYLKEAEKLGRQKHMKLEKEAQALLAALG